MTPMPEDGPGPEQPQPHQPQFGYAAPYGQVQYAPDHPRATTVLVLGICSLVLCGLLGPFAWAMGKNTLREIDASGGRLGGRGPTQAGYICGIIATVVLVVGLVIVAAIFVFGLAMSSAFSSG